jgi:2-phospho-L-lactate guanylyltransferase (CobY/MobA/RfbA family)
VNAVILVPVKDHREAKSRLAGLLTAQERTVLVQTMFEDVADALVHVPFQVVVVTNCPEAAQRAAGASCGSPARFRRVYRWMKLPSG